MGAGGNAKNGVGHEGAFSSHDVAAPEDRSAHGGRAALLQAEHAAPGARAVLKSAPLDD